MSSYMVNGSFPISLDFIVALLLLCHKNLRCNGDYVELPSNINVLRLHWGSSI